MRELLSNHMYYYDTSFGVFPGIIVCFISCLWSLSLLRLYDSLSQTNRIRTASPLPDVCQGDGHFWPARASAIPAFEDWMPAKLTYAESVQIGNEEDHNSLFPSFRTDSSERR